MQHDLRSGDFLVFQLEAGFALLRLLAVDDLDGEKVWHVAAYDDFFLDVESAETALSGPAKLSVNVPHIALTTRAFESTQMARIANIVLDPAETAALDEWRKDPYRETADRSIRLLLGLR